jgi:hypothetical protein
MLQFHLYDLNIYSNLHYAVISDYLPQTSSNTSDLRWQYKIELHMLQIQL